MQPIFESSTQKPCKSLQDFRVPRLYLILCLLRRISMALRRSNATVFDGDGSSWELVSNASSSTSESTSSDGSSGGAVPGPPADGAAAASGVSPGGAGSVLAAASAADRRRRAQLRFKWATRLRNPGYPMNQVEKPKRCVQFQRDWEQSRLEYYLSCFGSLQKIRCSCSVDAQEGMESEEASQVPGSRNDALGGSPFMAPCRAPAARRQWHDAICECWGTGGRGSAVRGLAGSWDIRNPVPVDYHAASCICNRILDFLLAISAGNKWLALQFVGIFCWRFEGLRFQIS